MIMRLHSYFRSSAAYRVRIALNLKRLDWEYVAVNLLTGEQKEAPYLALNPQGRVPSLETDQGLITQSPAILEYLEERRPSPPLLPDGRFERAHVRQLINIIACDIHPLNNSSVLGYLGRELGASKDQIKSWYGHWISLGFAALEEMLVGKARGFCYGDAPGLADCYLIPQLYNARRFDVPLEAFPTLLSIEENCLALDAFAKAIPENQPDCDEAPQ